MTDPDRLPAALQPLRLPVFRMLWLAWLAANLTMWMNDVAAAWLMTTLTTSPLMVALVVIGRSGTAITSELRDMPAAYQRAACEYAEDYARAAISAQQAEVEQALRVVVRRAQHLATGQVLEGGRDTAVQLHVGRFQRTGAAQPG